MINTTYGKTFLIAACLSLMLASTALAATAEQNTYARLVRAGMKQLKAGDHQTARDSFEKALRYINNDADAHLGLGVACFYLQDDRAAERELMKAVEIDPKKPAAYEFLGELFYREDDLETAATYWEKAVELNPSAKNLRARLDRIRKEHGTEREFNRDVTIHFLVKYDGRENNEAGRIILRILENAYGEIGQALSYYPDQKSGDPLFTPPISGSYGRAWLSGGIYDGKYGFPSAASIERHPASGSSCTTSTLMPLCAQ
jgi:tetratricopeptide (TPR) repeat protein